MRNYEINMSDFFSFPNKKSSIEKYTYNLQPIKLTCSLNIYLLENYAIITNDDEHKAT